MQARDPLSELLEAATGSTARYHSQAGPRPDGNVMVQMRSSSITASHRCRDAAKLRRAAGGPWSARPASGIRVAYTRHAPTTLVDPSDPPQIVMTALQPHRQLR